MWGHTYNHPYMHIAECGVIHCTYNLPRMDTQVAEYEATIGALESAHAKATSENSDLSSQLSEAESKASALAKAKSSLEAQLEETRSDLESESTVSY